MPMTGGDDAIHHLRAGKARDRSYRPRTSADQLRGGRIQLLILAAQALVQRLEHGVGVAAALAARSGLQLSGTLPPFAASPRTTALCSAMFSPRCHARRR